MKSQYEVERKKFSELEGSIVVPKYQRRLVWSETQKQDFIDNISKGYPFGSILLYQYENSTQKSLIDGLQRYSTLQEYKDNPAKYFKGFDPYIDRIIDNIKKGTPHMEITDSAREDLSQEIKSYLRKCLEQDEPDTFFLRDLINEKMNYPAGASFQDDLTRIQTELLKDANSYLNLDDLVIPCIFFTGDESQLPEVFANLNQGGTKLSKYQVLAAHWNNYDFKVPDDDYGNKVLNKVIERYDRLVEKRDMCIVGFDRDDMSKDRVIKLSEYCFALGELIIESVPVFWQSIINADSDKSEDTINIVGYLSTAIALGVDNRAISKLPDKRGLFDSEEFVTQLTTFVLKEYRLIQREFEKWLTKPGSGLNVEYESGAVTDMQVLSFFAALWHKHYTIDEEKKVICPIEGYKYYGYEATRKNLVAYCINDVVSKAWQGSGDSRLANYYVKSADAHHSYTTPLSAKTLSDKLLNWYDESSQRGTVNIEKISKMLLCIYSAPDKVKYKQDKYDIEHVIAKQRLREKDAYIKGNIPGGLLGNLMYLSTNTNRSKKQFNLYVLQEKYEGVCFDDDYLDMLSYPSRDAICRAEDNLSNGITKDAKSLIDARAKEMIARISKAVCG